MTCRHLVEDKLMQIKEIAGLSELRNMLGGLLVSFIELSKITCPAIAGHRIFQDWLKDVSYLTENTESYETDTIEPAIWENFEQLEIMRRKDYEVHA